VVSPNDPQREVLEKLGEYLDAGEPPVWVVYANPRSVVVYSRGAGLRTVVRG
jgi:hypothetical protein